MQLPKLPLAVLLLLFLLAPFAPSAENEEPAPEPTPASTWADVEEMVQQQRFEAALKHVDQLLRAAQESKDEAEWTRALIKTAQLRMALHGYETAVRFLKEAEWPAAKLERAKLELFYAQALVNYTRAYSWEINQRERTESKEEVDLKAWTRDEIYAEAQAAFLRVWQERKELGRHPLKAWEEYLVPGNYPERIRGTLRDAFSHLFAALLGDTSFWRPAETNEIYRLKLKDLLKGRSWALRAPKLDDPELHPIQRLVLVLEDLERWHKSQSRSEAAFDARLTRLHFLHASFTLEADRETIREHLRSRLPDMRRHEWWSVGVAMLAEFVRQQPDPWKQKKAREIAVEGQKAYPNSIGGQRCRHIVASIDSPAFNLESMANDGPERRSFRVRHKNLTSLHFRAYALDARKHIESAQDYNLLPAYREIEEFIRHGTIFKEWSVELPDTPDFELHSTFVTPPMKRSGLYVVVASMRPDFLLENTNLSRGVNIVIGDPVIVARQLEGSIEATVRSGASGEPLRGAKVSLYRLDYRDGHRRIRTMTTGADGRVTFEHKEDRQRYSHVLLVEHGDQIALWSSPLHFYRPNRSKHVTSTLIYSDRSVYRPLQTVHWKVLAYQGNPATGTYKSYPDAGFHVSLMDSNNQTVISKLVKTNEFGSASGVFDIPKGRLLGGWRIQTPYGSTPIRVEEYKRPTFEVELLDANSPLRLNREAELRGNVKYYFGLPVVNGSVSWRVERERIYPRWGWWGWWYRSHSTQAQTVAAGTGGLDEEGSFSIDFVPEADEREKETGTSYRYRVHVDVTDEGGETRSAQRSFRLGWVSVEGRIVQDKGFYRAGEETELKVMRTDLNDAPRAGSGRWRLVMLGAPVRTLLPAEQPLPEPRSKDGEPPFRTPGDALRPRWDTGMSSLAVLDTWSDGSEIASGKLEHGQAGEAPLALGSDLAPGAYRLYYETFDDFGERFEISEEFLVVGSERMDLPLPALLLAESPSVPVGETARFFVHSGLKNQAMVLEFYRAGQRLERRELRAGESSGLIEVSIGREDRGGFGATLALLQDHQFMRAQQALFVPWDDRELKLSFSSFRDRLKPGGRETWRVSIQGSDGQKLERGAAELLAYMYDRSLDMFAPHNPANPLSLYPNRTSVVQATSNLAAASQAWSRGYLALPGYPSLYPSALFQHGSYAIGGLGIRGQRHSYWARDEMRLASASVNGAVPFPSAPQRNLAGEMMRARSTKSSAQEDKEGRLDQNGSMPQSDVGSALRSNFSEKAFFQPHLVTGEDGSVSIEFEVPDSVTSWNVWLHTVTRDLRAGSLTQQVETVKDLMVRPYLPRFLREADRAEIQVVVNNASERELSGQLDFEIFDPDTRESLLEEFGQSPSGAQGRAFKVAPGGGTTLGFPIRVPNRVGSVAFKVMANAGDTSDGELRPLPILPSRVHLAQSRFVTLKDVDQRRLHFADLARGDDPTLVNDSMVVTIDAQLFYGVLEALPYLVNYPYECTEQTLNRFLSTGIVSSVFDRYPSVADMAKKMSKRETRFETWDGADHNRKMALEEMPWLELAKGGHEASEDLLNVLDPRIARAEREAALAKLRKAQTSLGGFPWFPGGKPSPYMTLYILHGFSKALEFDVEVPKDNIQRAWQYMHRHYLDEIVEDMVKDEYGWEFVTFLNYVLSNYPDSSWTDGVFSDAERKRMLDFSFKHWKSHSPYTKAYLALTLKRMNRPQDARLVFESIMDSAKTTQDQGTFWAPEDRSWLWYNDTIETHAFALRALMELEPDDDRSDGLVQWLFLNKKLNHWKSTRATAEVIYSLVHYLEQNEQLALQEEITVDMGTQVTTLRFDPAEYTGKKNQIVLPGSKIDAEKNSTIRVSKQTPGFAFASATWHFSTERLPAEARGDFLSVTRRYFKRVHDGREWTLIPLKEGAKLKSGDEVEVQLSLRSKHAAEYVHLRDPRAAGLEPDASVSKHGWNLGLAWYEETRDSATNFFFERLPVGEYTFKYRLRANMAGEFRVGPATVQSMYAPEFTAYSSGTYVSIEGP